MTATMDRVQCRVRAEVKGKARKENKRQQTRRPICFLATTPVHFNNTSPLVDLTSCTPPSLPPFTTTTTTTAAMASQKSAGMSTKGVTVVLGAQWGDEGKGKLSDILSQEADVCARCQVTSCSHWMAVLVLPCLSLLVDAMAQLLSTSGLKEQKGRSGSSGRYSIYHA